MIQMRIGALLLGILLFGAGCGPQITGFRQENRRQKTRPTPIFYPQRGGPFPAILLLPKAVHDPDGEIRIADRLSEAGYVAQVVDWGDRKFAGIFSNPAQMDSFKKVVIGSLDALKAQPGVDPSRIGVIGYGLGGFFVTYLASRPDSGLRAGVVYYGVYNVPEEVKRLQFPILAFQGEDAHGKEFIDNALKMKQVARDFQKPLELVFYAHARYGFDRSVSNRLEKANAENSWIRMINFINEHVKYAR